MAENNNIPVLKTEHLCIQFGGLKAVDATASCMGQENGMGMLVFALKDPDNIRRALIGEDVGTVVHP